MRDQAHPQVRGRPADPRRKGCLPRALGALSLVNLAGLILVWASETAVGERHWLTTILTYAPQQPLLLPALFLLTWALLSRRWRLAALNAGSAAFALFVLAGAALPVPGPAVTAGRQVRVMTLNVHHASAGPARVARLVRQVRPDILCIQEADSYGGDPDAARALHRLLPEWRMARDAELATVSRFPIRSRRRHAMPGGSGRAILETVLAVGGQRVTVLNTHFSTASHPRSLVRSLFEDPRGAPAYLRDSVNTRLEQAGTLLDLAAHTQPPLLAAGDFNTPPRGLLYRRLERRLRDSFSSSGRGLGSTFRTDLPLLRIDYIWAGAGVTPIRCFVPAASVSDHRPVVADLVL